MKRMTAMLLTLGLLSVALTGCQGGVTTPKTEALAEVTVGSDTYPPFVYMDENGDPTGIDVEIGREAFRRMGYDAVFMPISWEQKDALLASGEIDCVWGCFSMSGRESRYQWAGPYMVSRQVVAVNADSGISDFAGLAGKTIAVQSTGKPEEILLGKQLPDMPALEGVLSIEDRSVQYLPTLVQDVQDIIQSNVTAKGLSFAVDLAGVRDADVVADPLRLQRILLNILSNAVKFTPSGGSITLRVVEKSGADETLPANPDGRAASGASEGAGEPRFMGTAGPGSSGAGEPLPANPDGRTAGGVSEGDGGSISVGPAGPGSNGAPVRYGDYEFHVRDTGIGMSAEYQKHIFEQFSREETSTVSKTEGTGLGMPITKRLVEMMDGSIDLLSVQGQGTEFTVHLRLPLCGAPKKETPVADPEFAGMRLLVVEDNELNMEITTTVLEEAGFVVDQAVNGQAALEKIATAAPGQYALVLMDIQMPVMDGYEAARRIRALPDPAKAQIPIVAMTANAFAEDRENALAAGMNEHIAKPFDIHTLLWKLAEILKK